MAAHALIAVGQRAIGEPLTGMTEPLRAGILQAKVAVSTAPTTGMPFAACNTGLAG